MIFAIVAAILAYRKANDTGRSGVLWAVIAVAVFIGTQLLAGLVLGMALGVFLVATGRSERDFDGFQIILTIVAVVVSFVSTWLVLKYLDRVPQVENMTEPPPPPTNFN